MQYVRSLAALVTTASIATLVKQRFKSHADEGEDAEVGMLDDDTAMPARFSLVRLEEPAVFEADEDGRQFAMANDLEARVEDKSAGDRPSELEELRHVSKY